MKLHVGCGNVRLAGFVNVDLRQTQSVDLLGHAGDLHKVQDEQVDLLFSHAVFEHIFLGQHLSALREWGRVLSPSGVILCMGIPDFAVTARLYLEKQSGVIGERFDLFNVYRYTHGQPEHATPPIWQTFRPERQPNNAPPGWVPQLHKCLFDADYVQALLREVHLDAVLFNYAYPGEQHKLNLGFAAQKTAAPQPLSTKRVSATFAQVPDVSRSVNLDTLEFITPVHTPEQLLDYAKELGSSHMKHRSLAQRVLSRLHPKRT